MVLSAHNAVRDIEELQAVLETHRRGFEAAKVIISSANEEPDLQGDIRITKAVQHVGVSSAAVQKHLDSLGGRSRYREIENTCYEGPEIKKHSTH